MNLQMLRKHKTLSKVFNILATLLSLPRNTSLLMKLWSGTKNYRYMTTNSTLLTRKIFYENMSLKLGGKLRTNLRLKHYCILYFWTRCINFPPTYGFEMSSPCQPEENWQPCYFSSLIFMNQFSLAKLDTALTLSIYNCL